jgi:lysophospholipase L1-like esterase
VCRTPATAVGHLNRGRGGRLSQHHRWALATVVALAIAAGCAGADGERADAPPPTTTAPAPVTTTTVDRDEQARQAYAALSPQERAAFDLLAHPPQFPPPLAPRPDPGTPPVAIEIVQLGADRLPVLGPDGTPKLFTVHVDHRRQFVTGADGQVEITGEGSIVHDDTGRPILFTVERDAAGGLVREFFGNVKLVPLPPPPPRDPVFVLGDSVILGAQSDLPAALPGWTTIVDAQESRLTGRAAEVVDARRGEIDRVAVVMVGHNSGAGEDHATHIRRVLASLAGVERVVWVTAAEWGPGQVEFNAALREVAPEHPGLHVADWARYNAAFPAYTYDGLHLTPEGRAAMAALIAGYVGPVPPEGGP